MASPDLSQLEREYLIRAMDSGWISSKGEFIERFEQQFASYIGVKHAITCSSGTAALQLAYLSMQMIPECPMWVPDNTFIVTKTMAQLSSDHVTEVEVDKRCWVLPLAQMTHRMGVTVGVHLYGNPVDMSTLPKIQSRFVEDCAQAIGSEFSGKKVGSFGVLSCFSFYANKTLTTGEGGMVCTNDPKLADRIRLLKNTGMVKPYEHPTLGFNFRMTNLQAAIGCAQLERIEEICEKKRKVTGWYDSMLSRKFTRQQQTRGSKVVKFANAYQHPNASGIMEDLAQEGIETRPGFLPNNTIVFPSGGNLTRDQVWEVCETANGS